MDFERIVELIERRRDGLRDAASIGTASDPTAAQVAWERAEELDQLLADLKRLQQS
jgi:hypothetical protein